MKTTTIISTAFLTTMTLGMAGMGSVSAADVVMDHPTSTADVTFKANDKPTGPVDPTDPDQPVNPTDPDNPGTGNKGPLSLDFVSNIHFGEQAIQDTAYFAGNTHPYVQVSDKRGNGQGWQLSAAISDFTAKKDADTLTLKGAALSLNQGTIKTASTNEATAPTSDSHINLNTDGTPIMTAAENAGQGTWLDVFDEKESIALNVPAGNIVSGVAYNATITWTIGDTPQG